MTTSSSSIQAERGTFAARTSAAEAWRPHVKIVDGMLAKRFFAATPGGVLVDQPWIHDPSKTVGQALDDAGARRPVHEGLGRGVTTLAYGSRSRRRVPFLERH